MNVIVEISARHLHLSQEHLDILYGAGYKLTPKKDLSQPGQFACAEKVEVIGPKGSMKMSILGPVRPATQVEVSMTDARSLGIKAPVRESGDVKGSGACKLVGPCGRGRHGGQASPPHHPRGRRCRRHRGQADRQDRHQERRAFSGL